MKLSEAIRLGAMLRPQLIGDLRGQRQGDSEWGSCALGAAFEAGKCPERQVHVTPENIEFWKAGYVGFRGSYVPKLEDTIYITIIPASWEKVMNKTSHCPVCGLVDYTKRIITHLNDPIHRWTREQIADWLQTIEPKTKQKKVKQPVRAEV